jgi:hypothetical protein
MFTTLRVSATPVTAQMGSTPGDSAKPKTRVTVDPEVLNRKGQISPVLLRLRLRTDPRWHLRLRPESPENTLPKQTGIIARSASTAYL